MAKLTPILASEPSAAALLDMPLETFRELVQAGSLPRGIELAPGLVRWDVEDLRRIGRGDAAFGMDSVNWAP